MNRSCVEYKKTYHAWADMKKRCCNPKDKYYYRYGARGITICQEWLGKNGFKIFIEQMGIAPTSNSLDRIDNDVGYSKDNCKWSNAHEQQWNRSKTMNKTLSKHIGVTLNKRTSLWQVCCTKNGIHFNLGVYEDEICAAMVSMMGRHARKKGKLNTEFAKEMQGIARGEVK